MESLSSCDTKRAENYWRLFEADTLSDVIAKIMDIITAFDIYEDYYYWPLIRTQGDMEINNKYDSEHMDNRNFIIK